MILKISKGKNKKAVGANQTFLRISVFLALIFPFSKTFVMNILGRKLMWYFYAF